MVGKFSSIFSYAQDCWALMLAPCMAVFLMAIFWKRTTNKAAITTLFLAIPMLLIVFIREFFGILSGINIFNLSGILFIFSLIFTTVISLLTQPSPNEKYRDMIWRRDMLKLPEDQIESKYPWWKTIELWWGIVVLIFIVIYIRFW
jgi:SSS family solute:Na+ symporter